MNDADGELAGVGLKYHAFDAKDVAQVYQFEECPFVFRKFIFSEIELHIAGLVAKHAEGGLALAAANHNAAGHADMGFFLFQFICMVSDILCMMVPIKLLTIGFYAESANLFQLFAADQHLVIQLRSIVLVLVVCHNFLAIYTAQKGTRYRPLLYRECRFMQKYLLNLSYSVDLKAIPLKGSGFKGMYAASN